MSAKPSVLARLFEQVLAPGTFRPDRAAGVIYGVKVLGLQSRNDRVYSPDAVKRAARLYEGKRVYTNHNRRRPRAERDVRDLVGILRNVRWDGAGLRGDLHVNRGRSDMAGPLFEDAESRLGMYGLSHNAEGRVERRGGRDVVVEILKVHSVDLVDDPATVQSLWEEYYCGSKLQEEDMDPDTMPVDDTSATPMDAAPAPAMDAGPDAQSSLSDAVSAIFDDATLDMDDKKKAILALLKVSDDLMGGGDSGGSDTESVPEEDGTTPYDDNGDTDDEDSSDDDSEEDMKENTKNRPAAGVVLTERVKQLEREIAVRDLVESAGVRFKSADARKVFLKALSGLNDADRKALIEERKALTESVQRPGAARSQGSRPADPVAGVRSIFSKYVGGSN